MANAFTTDIIKWQVVDDEPILGSKNLAESGGIVNHLVKTLGQKLTNEGPSYLTVGFKAIGYFAKQTYLYSFTPLFTSNFGTFKWGIFTADKDLNDSTAVGSVTLSESLPVGTEIVLDQTFNKNQGLVVISDGPSILISGCPKADAELPNIIFAKLNNNSTQIMDYFGRNYCLSADYRIAEQEGSYSDNIDYDTLIGTNSSRDGIRIQEAISNTIINGKRHLLLRGTFSLSSSIELPSDFTLTLDGAYIQLMERADTNIIRSANIQDLSSAQNIVINGKNSVLDGNGSNQTTNNGSYKRIGVLLYNVNGFDISGFEIRNTHGWGMSIESGCQNGKIHDIHINQDGSVINQDGINVRGGCHDVEIYNISGYSHDDCIACTAMLGNVMQVDNTGSNGKDIYNISIHDIKMESGYCNVIDLIAHDTCKTHDITLYNIIDNAPDGKEVEQSGTYNATIMIGNYDFKTYAISGTVGTKNDLFNIHINNVISSSYKAVRFGWSCKNVTIENLLHSKNNRDCIMFWNRLHLNPDCENIFIDGLRWNAEEGGYVLNMQYGNISNLYITNIYCEICHTFIHNTTNVEDSYIVNGVLYGGTTFANNNQSVFEVDSFKIKANSFTNLYNPSKIGALVIGNNMPYKS